MRKQTAIERAAYETALRFHGVMGAKDKLGADWIVHRGKAIVATANDPNMVAALPTAHALACRLSDEPGSIFAERLEQLKWLLKGEWGNNPSSAILGDLVVEVEQAFGDHEVPPSLLAETADRALCLAEKRGLAISSAERSRCSTTVLGARRDA